MSQLPKGFHWNNCWLLGPLCNHPPLCQVGKKKRLTNSSRSLRKLRRSMDTWSVTLDTKSQLAGCWWVVFWGTKWAQKTHCPPGHDHVSHLWKRKIKSSGPSYLLWGDMWSFPGGYKLGLPPPHSGCNLHKCRFSSGFPNLTPGNLVY